MKGNSFDIIMSKIASSLLQQQQQQQQHQQQPKQQQPQHHHQQSQPIDRKSKPLIKNTKRPPHTKKVVVKKSMHDDASFHEHVKRSGQYFIPISSNDEDWNKHNTRHSGRSMLADNMLASMLCNTSEFDYSLLRVQNHSENMSPNVSEIDESLQRMPNQKEIWNEDNWNSQGPFSSLCSNVPSMMTTSSFSCNEMYENDTFSDYDQ